MNKTLRTLMMGLMALLAGSALASCSNDDALQVAPEGQKGYVEFSLSRGTETRTAYALNDANGLNVIWSEGDKVVVAYGKGEDSIVEVFDLVSGAGTTSARFAKADSQLADKSGSVILEYIPGYTGETSIDNYALDISTQEGNLESLGQYDIFAFTATLNNGKIESPEFRPMMSILHFPKGFDFGITATKADLVFGGGFNTIGSNNPEGDITIKNVSLTGGKLDTDIYVAIACFVAGCAPTSLKVGGKTFALPAITVAGKIYNFAESNLREMNKEPLTLEAINGGTITIKNPNGLVISYKVNDGTLVTSIKDDTSDIVIKVAAGDKVQLFGVNKSYGGSTESDSTIIQCSADCYIYGNIMSLIDADNFDTATELMEGWTFTNLFENNTYIKNHDRMALILPATTLAVECYREMFRGCTGLTKAPELPATTMEKNCYNYMFSGCTGLTTAPELPATKLASQCYSYMFSGCTGLTTAPELPATKLASYCYSDMFYYCTGLTTAPEKLPATTLADACYYEMFIHCTSLTTAPELPAKELKSRCYSDMFHGCTSLTYLKCLATSIASGATHSPTNNWVIGVPASGTFVKDASVRFGSGEFWNTSEEYGSTTSCAAKAIANWTVQDYNVE